MKRHTWIAFVACTLLPAAMALACPMCKDSIPNSDAQAATGLPSGFNVSVYAMLIGFLATLGLATTVIAKGIRNTNTQIRGFDVQKRDAK
jgi:hypothetical protein